MNIILSYPFGIYNNINEKRRGFFWNLTIKPLVCGFVAIESLKV